MPPLSLPDLSESVLGILPKLDSKPMGSSDFRRAVEARDLDGMMAWLTHDVRLFSPVSFTPFEGADAVRALFEILLDVFEDFRYVDELAGEGIEGLRFCTRVGDREVEGIDLLEFNSDGLVDRFTVMVRPMSAVHALAEAVGARLQKT